MHPPPDRIEPIRVGPDGAAVLALSLLVVLASGGLTLLAAAAVVLRAALRRPPAEADGPVVVLGQRLGPGGAVPPAFCARLARAAALWRRGARPVLVLGGATRPGAPAEAAAAARVLAGLGVAPADVVAEAASRNTLENLRQARAALPAGAVAALVTSRVHLARASALARGMRIPHRPWPAEDRLPAAALAAVPREALLLHWYATGRLVAAAIRSRRLAARVT